MGLLRSAIGKARGVPTRSRIPVPNPVSKDPIINNTPFVKNPVPVQDTLALDALKRRLALLENREIPAFDPTDLQTGIAGLQERFKTLPKFDDSLIRDRLRTLENREIPVFDPSELKTSVAGLQERISNIPQFDPSQLQEQIQANRDLLGNIPQFDDSALRNRLQALEGREIPQFDASGLQSQIGSLQDRLANLPQFDPTQLQQGIAGLEDRLANIPQFDPSQLQQQIQANKDLLGNIPQFDDSALRERLQALEGREIPQFDPSQLQAGIQGLSDRISNLPQFDPSALQTRLANLEGRELPTFNPEDFRDQFLSIAREGIDIPQPTAPDLSGFARLEDLQTFDDTALQNRLQALENREIPQPVAPDLSGFARLEDIPTFDRDALIADIRGGLDIPKPPSIDRDALIADIQNRIKLPEPSQPFDPSGLQSRLGDLEKRLADLSAIQPLTPVDPIVGQPGQIEPVSTPIVEPKPMQVPEPLPPRPPSIGGIGGINQDPRPLERPIIPPKRDDFMSIERLPIPSVQPIMGKPLVIGSAPPREQTGLTAAELLELSDEELQRYIPRETIGQGVGSTRRTYDFTPSPEEFRERLQRELNPDPNDLRPLGRRYNLVDQSPQPTQEPVVGSDLMRTDTNFDVRPIPVRSDLLPPPRGGRFEPEPVIDPVTGLADLTIGEPAYDTPVVGEPVQTIARPPQLPPDPVSPVPTTPTAVATDVGTDPVTTISEDTRGQVDPVLAQQDTRELQTDPLLRALYFGTADQPGFINQLQQATANLIGSDVPLQGTAGLSDLEQMAQDRALADLGVAEPFVGESADLIRGATREFDPSMTQQFFNPFENQVVQQTIQDVLEAGEKRDVAQRARDIQTGGLSAFGSRARLTAADRQEALGRGLAEALGGIRQAGFGQAQRDALTTFAQQRQAEQQAARDLGQVGTTLADLRARERAGLAGFGQTGRGIEETALSRLFQQQLDQQGRPLQALQITGSLLPQFQAGSTQIDSQYRLPADPTALGLGAAFGAYTSLKPPGTQTG